MLVSDFNFALPENLIAQTPPVVRGDSRMLLLNRGTGAWQDSQFAQFPEQLRAGDVLVLNSSRVIPARLYGMRSRRSDEREAATGRIEVLITSRTSEWEWTALVKPGRKLRIGDRVHLANEAGDVTLDAEIIAAGERGERTLRFSPVADFDQRLDAIGHMPLPPYIHREVHGDDAALDRERYQTVYAEQRGSSAAPTAGLHFTPNILDRLRMRGVQVCCLTLHVGLGTFRPVTVGDTEQIQLHREQYQLTLACCDTINAARREGRRIVAAGTTTVRTLEHCAAADPDGTLHPHSGSTTIFISPGYRFRIVNALLTNFHLPQSTLLMLVSAFAGRDNTLAAYRHAVEAGYRFFSYGDCMFIS